MKYKTKKKDVMNGYTNIISVGYCGLHFLLKYEQETAYTVRQEGWGADIYQFGNTAIVTGYAPFGNIRPGYEVNQRYEQKAIKAVDRTNSWKENKAILAKIIKEYIREVTQ